MSEHTPGPWVVRTLRPRTFGRESVDGPGRVRIADCGAVVGIGPHGPCLMVDPDEIEANARLIAAAPDLLAALRAHHDWQLSSGAWLVPDPHGGAPIEIDNAAEYADSSLCQQTLDALAARGDGGEE